MVKNYKRIYCISGLGADEKIFEGIIPHEDTFVYLQWLQPNHREDIQSYADRMSQNITPEESPILLGVSFGGMIAIEIARRRAVKALVLISSVKTYNELPRWMRISGHLNLHKLIPTRFSKLTEGFDNRQLGIKTKYEVMIVNGYRKQANATMMAWGVKEVLKWKNSEIPENCIHIHGSEDRVFPIRNIRPTHIIDGGSHIMILNRKEEIKRIISMELHKI